MLSQQTRCVGGDCIDIYTHDCSGTLYTGLCPGGSNIKCCKPGATTLNPCNYGGGKCINTYTTTCGGPLISGRCPGPTEYKCCKYSRSPRSCSGGACKNTYSDSCSGSYASGLCPGPSNIKCCQSGGGDLTYPVVGYSSAPSLDGARGFGDRRSSGSRCHAGCDIQQGTAQAVADGEVTNVYYFYNCSGGSSHAVLVYHPSLDVTIVYGEINSNAIYVSKGQQVTKGKDLGKATRCGMLHFEVYSGRRTSNQRWYPPSGGYVGYGETCATKYPQTKPAALMNCEDFLNEHF